MRQRLTRVVESGHGVKPVAVQLSVYLVVAKGIEGMLLERVVVLDAEERAYDGGPLCVRNPDTGANEGEEHNERFAGGTPRRGPRDHQ